MKNKIYYLHAPAEFSRRGTVAGILKTDTLHIGVAIVSKKDSFSKAIGRTIAEGRAQKHAMQVIALPSNFNSLSGAEQGKFIHIQLKETLQKAFVKHKIFKS